MKKIIIFLGLMVSLLVMSMRTAQAITVYQIQPRISLTLLPTNTPTPKPTIKVGKIIPLISLIPIATSTPTITPAPTNTIAPVATLTLTPTKEETPTVEVTKTIKDMGATVEPTKESTQTTETPDQTSGKNTTSWFTIITIGLLGLIVVVQAWPKIRSWLHQKTQ